MKEHILYIKTYKVPIERTGEEIKEKMVEITSDMLLVTETIKIKSPILEIPELGKKIAGFNKRQLVIAENTDRDYIKKKIITKQ